MKNGYRILLIATGVLGGIILFGGSALGAVAGDTDGSGDINLRDGIIGLQLCAGIPPEAYVFKKYELSGNEKIGLEEVINALQVVAGLKQAAYIWYKDEDEDGYSDGTKEISPTRPSAIYYSDTEVFTSGDLDDTDPNVHPSTEGEWIAFDDVNPAPPDDIIDVTVPVSSPDEVIIEYGVPGMNAVEMPEDGEIYDVLDIPGAAYMTEVGKPQVPIVRRYVAMPEGALVTPSVLASNHRTLEEFHIYPAQEPLPEIDGYISPPFRVDSATYQNNAFFPSEVVQLEGPVIIRGVSTVIMQINPVQFNPVTNQVRVYSYLKIGLTLQGATKRLRDNRYSSPSFDVTLKRLLLNNDFLNSEQQSRSAYDAGNSLLIITHPNFLTAANTLKEWKIRKGIETEVRTTSQTGSSATAIQSYIKNAYQTWNPPPTYVLFIGDSEYIPCHYMTPHPLYDYQWAPQGRTGTDLYYATVDGSDYFPDISIGRLSVDTSEQASKRVNDIIGYEKAVVTDSNFYNKTAICAEFQDQDDYDPLDGRAARRFAQTSEDIAMFLSDASYLGKYTTDRIYFAYSYVNPEYWSNWFFGGGPAGEKGALIPYYLKKPGFAWNGSSSNIISAVNNGRFLVTHRDHGSTGGWAHPAFSTYNAQSLNNGNKLPVVWSVNCQTGWFDNETDDSMTGTSAGAIHFSEAWERNPNGGAIGLIAASRISYSGHNDRLAWGWMDAIWPSFEGLYSASITSFDEPMFEMGPVLNYGKYYYATKYPEDIYRRTGFEMFHWFGDPTMQLWTDVPQNLLVSHVPSQIRGTNSLAVNVTESGALICITDGSRIVGRKISVSGSNVLSWSTLSPEPDSLHVTVTKHNFRPYEGVVNRVLSQPGNVTATKGTYSNKVGISWNSVSGASHYRVYYNTINSCDTATPLTAFWQQGLYNEHFVPPGQTYSYWVKAATDSYGANASACGGPDTGYAGSDYPQPNRITDLTLTKNNTDVILSWGALAENVTHYQVYRANNPAMTDNLILLSTTTDAIYTDSGAIGNSYFYAIVPINVTREGPMSNLGYVKVFHFAPTPPYTQGLYWIGLPPRHEYNFVSDIVTDWGLTDDSAIIVFGRFNYDTQQYEDYFFFPAIGEWAGDNFAVGPCEAFCITIESEVTLNVVGSDDPDYEITAIPNPDISDYLITGLPYGAIYQHSNDLITALGSEDGSIINTLTEYKNDGHQGQYSYSYLPSLGSWDYDLGFDLEIGVPIEVTLSDPGSGILNWKPETYPVQ